MKATKVKLFKVFVSWTEQVRVI